MEKFETLIQLINLDEEICTALKKEKLKVTTKNLNGILPAIENHIGNFVRLYDRTPYNIHEMDYIVVSNNMLNLGQMGNEGPIILEADNDIYDATLFDMYLLRKNIIKTSSEQCVIFFAGVYNSKTYNVCRTIDEPSHPTYHHCDNLGFSGNGPFAFEQRTGTLFRSPEKGLSPFAPIVALLEAYEAESYYGTIYTKTVSPSQILMFSKNGEIIAKYEKEYGKHVFYLPNIANKKGFLIDLFTKALPECDFYFFKRTLSDFGLMKWVNDFEYISHEEKIKRLEIEKEIKLHSSRLDKLQSDLIGISEKNENVWVKALLTESSDNLVNAIYNFLSYIEFPDITLPDDAKATNDNQLLEEDINVSISPDYTYLIECKGIGGTSKDDDCRQIDKIVLRRMDAAEEAGNENCTFHGLYIVNHQRYKAPEMRDNPPFNQVQINDARIARRSMTTTYELFKVYHMIKGGVIDKKEARESFRKIGLLDFRRTLNKLICDTKFKDINVYSFDLKETPNVIIKKTGKIIIEDIENHWHKLPILGLQVDGQDVNSASYNDKKSAGVKVERFIANPKNFYYIE